MPSEKDIVKVAHELLSQHSRIHALHDSDPNKDVDVAWVISALAEEVERVRALRNNDKEELAQIFVCDKCDLCEDHHNANS